MEAKGKNIIFVGLKDIHPDDQEKIKNIILNKYPFIERDVRKITQLKLHIKLYKEGVSSKYSMHLSVDSPRGLFVADHVSHVAQWDPISSTYMLIDKIREQARHKYHLDQGSQWRVH